MTQPENNPITPPESCGGYVVVADMIIDIRGATFDERLDVIGYHGQNGQNGTGRTVLESIRLETRTALRSRQ
jgi:hypothetical protein